MAAVAALPVTVKPNLASTELFLFFQSRGRAKDWRNIPSSTREVARPIEFQLTSLFLILRIELLL
ncbi:hypothetical protein GN244_ATG09963 [Phytophthora infestans]|uniref:Uncharacterized protein n=1 Tax=Phytophthora infestans TaxID=4787 RepID=A0A833STL3_PHYIN|nr:hypothetical protein GN244_ATG09963 [Phytophthora infestans]KAF4150180.1 hypothetical protein GN958_ATG00601 [Phytophthora infestans]